MFKIKFRQKVVPRSCTFFVQKNMRTPSKTTHPKTHYSQIDRGKIAAIAEAHLQLADGVDGHGEDWCGMVADFDWTGQIMGQHRRSSRPYCPDFPLALATRRIRVEK